MAELIRTNFDYSVVDSDTKGDLIYHADQIRKAHDAANASVVDMGEYLAAAQELLANYSGGTFLKWVEAECGFKKSTAYKLIHTYQAFGSFPHCGKLEDSAMYALAAPETPKKARSEALKLAEKGVFVTHKKAKEIIEKCKKPKPVEDATESTEPEPEKPSDKCPVCAGEKWKEDEDGWVCSKCNHPYGEPAGDSDEDRIATQRSKTVKTGEALLRAIDDLQHICPNKEHAEAIRLTKAVLAIAKEWK